MLINALLSAGHAQVIQQKVISQNSLAQPIKLWDRNFQSDYMREQIDNILRLSSDKYGEYKLVSSHKLEQGRAFSQLTNNKDVDIFIGGIDTKREEKADVIYFPLDRGLLGFRVCLTESNNKVLDSVVDLPSLLLSKIVVGSGTHWPDKAIFEQSGVSVVTSPQYINLFEMLNRGRFDCMPRSLAEVEGELETIKQLNIKLDDNLAFIYPLAEFMFVSKNNPKLTDRLQYGLNKAITDKSFFEIFNKHRDNKKEKFKLQNRKIIYLKNESLSKKASDAINKYGVADASWK